MGLEDRLDGALEVRLSARSNLAQRRHGVLSLHRVDEIVAADKDDHEADLTAGDLPREAHMLTGRDHVIRRRIAPRPVVFVPLVARLAATPGAERAKVQSARFTQNLNPVASRAPVRRIELILVGITVAQHTYSSPS